MRNHKLLIAVIALALVLVAGVGATYLLTRGPSDAEVAAAQADKERERQEAAEVKAAEEAAVAQAEKEAEAAQAEAERNAAITSCRNRLRDYVGALQDLNSALDVGINFTDYTAEVRSIAKVSNDARPGKDVFCKDAKWEADMALWHYSSLASDWSDCIYGDDLYCDVDVSVDWQLWNKADTRVTNAKKTMNGIDPHADDDVENS